MESFQHECNGCGRTFAYTNAFSLHQRTCKKSKARLSSALDTARENWARLKRARISGPVSETTDPQISVTPSASTSKSIASLFPTVSYDSTGTSNYTTPLSGPSSSTLAATATEVTEIGGDATDTRPISQRKPFRKRVLPKRFRDTLPEPQSVLPPKPVNQAEHQSIPLLKTRLLKVFQTPWNVFGLSRKYTAHQAPDHDPEDYTILTDLIDKQISTECLVLSATSQSFYPYPNKNSFLLGNWYWCNGAQKSQVDFERLIDIVGDPDFKPEDVRDTKWDQINKILGDTDFNGEEWEDIDAGWIKSSVTIRIPFPRQSQKQSAPSQPIGPQVYTFRHFYHRSIISVIREKLSSPSDDQLFHYEPFELLWRPSNTSQKTSRVHSELYCSSEFLRVHRDLQESPTEPGCDLPRVVVALMFWSDSTHLTSFGNAKLWPLYMGFGNESKYRRCRPSLSLLNHIAYFEQLPDDFKDFVALHSGGKVLSNAFYTHCHRELLHAQWKIILDDNFIQAYVHGIVITCSDGILRRFYPRIFTYSADYPEKIALASIRNLGGCPCPRCLIPLDQVHKLGTKTDKKQRKTLARVDNPQRRQLIKSARDIIYNLNRPVDCKRVEDLLKQHSYVPTENAFSCQLGPFPGFNMFDLFVVDFMHEVELGVWRSLFIHLMRILQAVGPGCLQELDRRYRDMPTFGHDTIRRFSANSSEMKKMAAHNFEDLLQCAIPCFEGLVPEPHNRIIMDLLFLTAHWHGLAKLRMHIDETLAHLDDVTSQFGDQLRTFKNKTCLAFETAELPRETRARNRRQILQAAKRRTENKPQVNTNTQESDSDPALGQGFKAFKPKMDPKSKSFNLNTYKAHSLGDYTDMIRRYGTIDSYNTEMGELEHRTPKARYRRTSKKYFIQQITQIERRQHRIRRLRVCFQAASIIPPPQNTHMNVENAFTADTHHFIGKSQNEYENISTFLSRNAGDPAIQDFLPRLKEHLLPRIKDIMQKDRNDRHDLGDPIIIDDEPNPPGSDFNNHKGTECLFFKNDRLYKHRVFRINYTTYDIRRAQDVINPNTSHRDIMVLRDDSDDVDGEDGCVHSRFAYARVLGIYHANVVYTGTGSLDYQPRRMEFLWIRWFQPTTLPCGWASRRLDCIKFFPVAHKYAFGFLDPSDVLRACHILPRIALGRVHDGVGLSKCARDQSDWQYYYVNRFVDRDMIMRFYWGLGVGHTYSHGTSSNDSDVDMDVGQEGRNEEENGLSNNGANISSALNNIDEDEEEDEENLGAAEELGLGDRDSDIWAGSDSDEGDPHPRIDGDDSESSGGEEELELEATYSGEYY